MGIVGMALPAFVLHSRPYKESSALVDLFTPQGRLRAVLRSARGKSGSQARPFLPLEIELRGKGELKTLSRLEPNGIPNLLHGDVLFSGLYLNELLIRLLPAQDPQPELFEHYGLTLQALAAGRPLQPLLAPSSGDCWTSWAMVSPSTGTSTASRWPRSATTACCPRPAWKRSSSCSPGCSWAATCWPWPRPTGNNPPAWPPPNA